MNGTHTLRKHYKNVWFFLLKNSFLKGGGGYFLIFNMYHSQSLLLDTKKIPTFEYLWGVLSFKNCML